MPWSPAVSWVNIVLELILLPKVAKRITIRISDILGQERSSISLNQLQFIEVDVVALQDGLYIVTIETPDEVAAFKISIRQN